MKIQHSAIVDRDLGNLQLNALNVVRLINETLFDKQVCRSIDEF